MIRRRAKKGRDKKYFSATANKTHKKNLRENPMRGGFRI